MTRDCAVGGIHFSFQEAVTGCGEPQKMTLTLSEHTGIAMQHLTFQILETVEDTWHLVLLG